MQGIQNLIFDLGNVIIPLEDYAVWWEEVFLDVFENKQVVENYRTQGFFEAFEKGAVGSKRFYRDLSSFLKSEYTEVDLRDRWNGILKTIPPHRLDFLKMLSEKYKLYLLSNTNEVHIDDVRAQLVDVYGRDVLADIFDHCYYSYEIRMLKPDAEIYERVLNDHGLEAGECLFLDDKEENIRGAESVGIRAQLIHPDEDIAEVLSFLL